MPCVTGGDQSENPVPVRGWGEARKWQAALDSSYAGTRQHLKTALLAKFSSFQLKASKMLKWLLFVASPARGGVRMRVGQPGDEFISAREFFSNFTIKGSCSKAHFCHKQLLFCLTLQYRTDILCCGKIRNSCRLCVNVSLNLVWAPQPVNSILQLNLRPWLGILGASKLEIWFVQLIEKHFCSGCVLGTIQPFSK